MSSALITTLNLNGIRAAHRRGLMEWLALANPDVLLLQEVRAPEEVTEALLGPEWNVHTHPCAIKGRAGVAVALRRDGQFQAEGEPRLGLSPDEPDYDTGRWVELDLVGPTDLTVVSAYFHSGSVGTLKQEQKMAHLPRIEGRLEQLLDQNALVAGDFNVVRSELDIKNWKGNHNKSAGVLDEEIAFLNRWVDSGWSDVVRDLAGPNQGPYSWWSWRGKAFDNDAGWRIDYQYASRGLAQSAQRYEIFRAPSWDARFSDHAPVTVEYQFS